MVKRLRYSPPLQGAAKKRRRRVEARAVSAVVQRIFEEIESRGISQTSIAEVTGRTPAAVTHWKTGRAIPDILTVEILLEVLGLEIHIRKRA